MDLDCGVWNNIRWVCNQVTRQLLQTWLGAPPLVHLIPATFDPGADFDEPKLLQRHPWALEKDQVSASLHAAGNGGVGMAKGAASDEDEGVAGWTNLMSSQGVLELCSVPQSPGL